MESAGERVRIFRADYQPPEFHIPYADLDVALDAERTVIRSTLRLRRNVAVNPGGRPLSLDAVDLEFLEVALDGRVLGPSEYHYDGKRLVFATVPDVCTVTTKVAVNPSANTSMMGLSVARDGELWTQFEAEAFRKVTPFIDRPDVLAKFTIRLEGSRQQFPVLLASGNRSGAGLLADDRHWAVFHTPVPTPCYVMAFVAGRLECVKETFRTRSGREIEVGIYANSEHIGRCAESLKLLLHAMRWDEDVFGREYDLDMFNCAVLNGGAGAMENKGLNLYDINFIVADPEVTIDHDYEYRLKTIAHEYFHNWTGNKVTNQSWFHLSLKEGLTRVRDQLLLSDFIGHGATRIRMLKHIRANQFGEDDSAVAHPCIRDSYIEPRNLYTFTVYDKAEEIMQMLIALMGRDRFASTVSWFLDEYCDGAVTIDAFLDAFEQVGGIDMTQFRRWYYQSGTCEVGVTTDWNAASSTLSVTLAQSTRPTADGQEKLPLHVPLAIGLVGPAGEALSFRVDDSPARTDAVLELRETRKTWELSDVKAKPTLSVFRGASAPIRLRYAPGREALAHLIAHDGDELARWDAAQRLGTAVVLEGAASISSGETFTVPEIWTDALAHMMSSETVAPRMRAELLTLPDERALGAERYPVDVDGIHAARLAALAALGHRHRSQLWDIHRANANDDPRDMTAVSMGRRRLANVAMDLLIRADDEEMVAMAERTACNSGNLTNRVAALSSLCSRGGPERDRAVAGFYERAGGVQMVVDQWCRAQISASRADTVQRVDELMASKDFNFGMFSRLFTFAEAFFYENRYAVNEPSGAGYALMTEQLIRMDRALPFVSNWTLNCCDLTRWQLFDARRQTMMRHALKTMIETPDISPGLYEICEKSLSEAIVQPAA